MLNIKHTVKCDQPGCYIHSEQEFQSIQLHGQIPIPNIPAGWLYHPSLGFLCSRHKLVIQDIDFIPMTVSKTESTVSMS